MRVVFRLLISTVTFLAACTEVPGEPPAPVTVSTVNRVTANRVTANRVTANRLAGNRLPTDGLMSSRLSDGRLAVNMNTAGELLSTEGGREVFSFVVSCALPSDVTLTANVDGTPFEFTGEIGLTPEWLTAPLSRVGQGWISACIFARVNGDDVALPISVRGGNVALATNADERTEWSVEEGAFYGNLFTPLDQPILWIACRGAGQLNHPDASGLTDRMCAKPDPANPGFTLCGFIFAGDCGSFAADQVCAQYSGSATFYRQCSQAPLDSSGEPGADNPAFAQVITTYVVP